MSRNKSILKSLSFVLLLQVIFTITSCEKDNGSSGTTVVSLSGSWKVSSYTNNGTDSTNLFTGYIFIFYNNNTIKATKNASSINGTWNSITGINDNKISIDFANTPALQRLNADWIVLEKIATRLKLSDTLSGSNEHKLLTLINN